MQNKNPPAKDAVKWTPMHLAASAGLLNMCKLILKNTDDKNPKTTVPSNVTPVALAQDARKEAIDEGKNKEVSKYDAITELLRRKSARLQISREK